MPAEATNQNPELKIGSGVIFCTEAVSNGDIFVGANTVVHPKAQILAESGPIIIGENNLIEENACIINMHLPSKDGTPVTLTIGNNNVFEVGSKCEALKVGDNNVIEVNAFVGPKVEITSGCIIGACCKLKTAGIVPLNTIVFGLDCSRRTATEKPAPQTSQLEHLRKVLPNYHYIVAGTAKKP